MDTKEQTSENQTDNEKKDRQEISGDQEIVANG